MAEQSSDVCYCGDYRSEHIDNGPCRTCTNLSPSWHQCAKFRLSHHADQIEARHWHKYHSQYRRVEEEQKMGDMGDYPFKNDGSIYGGPKQPEPASMPELEPLRELIAKWQQESSTYPPSELGIASRVSVRMCGEEVLALLPQIEKDIAEHDAKVRERALLEYFHVLFPEGGHADYKDISACVEEFISSTEKYSRRTVMQNLAGAIKKVCPEVIPQIIAAAHPEEEFIEFLKSGGSK